MKKNFVEYNGKKYYFGREPSPFDKNDWKLENYIPEGALKITPIVKKSWDFPATSLDQEDTPHCVGFGTASWGINSPINTMYTNEDGHRFYYLCKEIDGEPGEENGSYIRSAAKVLRNEGRIEAYAFATNMESIKWWLLNKGPIISGTIWTEGMLEPDHENKVHITGKVVGGHAILLNEWTEDEHIGFQNSWGKKWGNNGKAYISVEDYEILFHYNGEAMTAVELPPKYKHKDRFCERICKIIRQFFQKLFN